MSEPYLDVMILEKRIRVSVLRRDRPRLVTKVVMVGGSVFACNTKGDMFCTHSIPRRKVLGTENPNARVYIEAAGLLGLIEKQTAAIALSLNKDARARKQRSLHAEDILALSKEIGLELTEQQKKMLKNPLE